MLEPLDDLGEERICSECAAIVPMEVLEDAAEADFIITEQLPDEEPLKMLRRLRAEFLGRRRPPQNTRVVTEGTIVPYGNEDSLKELLRRRYIILEDAPAYIPMPRTRRPKSPRRKRRVRSTPREKD